MAGLIPKSFIHDLLDRADIVEVVDSRVPLKKAGKNHQACCPFHNEKTPSFTVSADKQFYHCFGCGEHGNAIDFLINYDGLSFPDAVDELAAMLGLEVPREASENPQKDAQKRQQAESDYEVMQQATRFFQHQLKHHARAGEVIDYLKGRGLNGETVKQFQIGYAPSEWDALKQTFARNPQTTQQLLDLKLLNRSDNGRVYDFFRDRVMFPIHDRRGRVIGFGGRILEGDGPKYLNSPETRVFHKGSELYGFYQVRQAHRQPDVIVIVEGYMDVVALAQHGINYAVASLGTATTTEQLQRLFRTTHQVVCCYDGDRAGRDAAWRALENALPLLKDGLDLRFLFLPEGEDPDSIVQAEGAKGFEARLQQAQPFTEYFFEHLQQGIDVKGDAGRSQLLQRAKPLIERIASDFYRDTLMERLAEKLRREKSQLQTHFQRPQQSRYQPEQIQMTPMRRAIALLVQFPQLGQQLPLNAELKRLGMPGIEVFLSLHQQTHEQAFTTAQLLETWRESAHYKHLQKLASWQHAMDEETAQQELNDIIVFLIDKYVEQRADELLEKEKSQELSKAERKEYQLLIQHLRQKKT